MPIIPKIERRTYPIQPLPEVSPEMVGSTFAPITSIGQKLERFGEMGLNVQSMIQKAEDLVALNKLVNLSQADIDKKELELRQRSDYWNFDNTVQEFNESMKTNYLDPIANNPRLTKSYEPHLMDQLNKFNRNIGLKKIKELSDEAQAQILISSKKYAQLIGQESDPNNRELLKTNFEIELEEYIKSNLITREWANAQVNKIMGNSEEARIINFINSENPIVVDNLIKEIDDKKFTETDPKQLAIYRGTAQTQLNTLVKRLQKEEDDFVINKTIEHLTGNWRRNYGVIEELISNPSFQEKWNLNPDRVKAIREYFKGEEGWYNNQLSKVYDERESEILGGYSQMVRNPKSINPLDWINKIDLYVSAKELPVEKGKTWINSFKNFKIDTQTNYEVYAKLRSEVTKYEGGKETITDNILKDIGVNLSPNDGEELLKILESKKQSLADRLQSLIVKHEEAGLGKAFDVLKYLIAPEITGVGVTPVDYENLARAMMKLDSEVTQARKKGEPLPDLVQRAKEISLEFQRPLSERVRDYEQIMSVAEEARFKKYETIESLFDALRKGEIREDEMRRARIRVQRREEIKIMSEKYKTKEEVVNDYWKKKLNANDASDILKYKFGVKE